ncbi:unnamed protein product [Amoebophrya sp. A120]|nr:unnamed protein product [Amoebophrya sp. A120]|eukprot:GSA120T00022892001.1
MAASSTGPPAVAGPASTGPPTSATATKPVRGLERHSDPCSFTVQEETLCVRRSALEKALGWKQNSSEYAELLKQLGSANLEVVHDDTWKKTLLRTLEAKHPPAVLLGSQDRISILPSGSIPPKLIFDTQKEIEDIAAAVGLTGTSPVGGEELKTTHLQAPSSKSSGTTPPDESDNQAKLQQGPRNHQNRLACNEEKASVQRRDRQVVVASADEYDDFAAPFLQTAERVCEYAAAVLRCVKKRQRRLELIRLMARQWDAAATDSDGTLLRTCVHDPRQNILTAAAAADGLCLPFRLVNMGKHEITAGKASSVAVAPCPSVRDFAVHPCLLAEPMPILRTLESVLRQEAIKLEAAFVADVGKRLEEEFQLPEGTFARRLRYREQLLDLDEDCWDQSALKKERDCRQFRHTALLRFANPHNVERITRSPADAFPHEMPFRDTEVFPQAYLGLWVCLYTGEVYHCWVQQDDIPSLSVDLHERVKLGLSHHFGLLDRSIPVFWSTEEAREATYYTGFIVIELRGQELQFSDWPPGTYEREENEEIGVEEDGENSSSHAREGAAVVLYGPLPQTTGDDEAVAVAGEDVSAQDHGDLSTNPAHTDANMFINESDSSAVPPEDDKQAVRITFQPALNMPDSGIARKIDFEFGTGAEARTFLEELKLLVKIVREHAVDGTRFADIITGEKSENLWWKNIFPGFQEYAPENVKFLVEELQDETGFVPADDNVDASQDERRDDDMIEGGEQDALMASAPANTTADNNREKLLPDEEEAENNGTSSNGGKNKSPSAQQAQEPASSGKINKDKIGSGFLKADHTWLDVAAEVFEKRRRRKEPMKEPIEIRCVFPQLEL